MGCDTTGPVEVEGKGTFPPRTDLWNAATGFEFTCTYASGVKMIVSSGGPISTAVGLVLGLSADAVIELNLRIRNSALTEFHFTPKRHALVSFNSVAHLEQPGHADWITYA